MPYGNRCTMCGHVWNTPTEKGPAEKCPACGSTGPTVIGSAFTQDDPIVVSEPAVTTQFAPESTVTAAVKKPERKPGPTLRKK